LFALFVTFSASRCFLFSARKCTYTMSCAKFSRHASMA
jgi:hypothetical protein